MKRFARLAWTVLGFNLLVILWGALVRASHSGEGCGDHWPLCNGSVIPHAAEIATIIEFTHRATTGVAFILVIAMYVWARRNWKGEPIAAMATASLVLIVTEALLGAGLVLFRYSGTDASFGRAAYLAAHLVNTLFMLAAMALTAWWASGHRPSSWTRLRSNPVILANVAVLAVAVTGAVTALADTLFPSGSLITGFVADFSPGSHWLVRLRSLHPLIAGAGAVCVVLALIKDGGERVLVYWAVGLLALQLCIGVMNLSLLTPVWTQILHLLTADLLWIVLVLLAADLAAETPERADAAPGSATPAPAATK